MPHYEIHSSIPITARQRSELAQNLTELHCETFNAPPLFVNVTFHDAVPTYVAGREVKTNYIHAHIRPRPLAPETIAQLSTNIMIIWQSYINPSSPITSNSNSNSSPLPPGSLLDPKTLHNVFIMQTISGGMEQGLYLPVAGKDEEWLERYEGEFRERAEGGDEGMRDMVGWMERRKNKQIER